MSSKENCITFRESSHLVPAHRELDTVDGLVVTWPINKAVSLRIVLK